MDQNKNLGRSIEGLALLHVHRDKGVPKEGFGYGPPPPLKFLHTQRFNSK
jgi:hypothetical protein